MPLGHILIENAFELHQHATILVFLYKCRLALTQILDKSAAESVISAFITKCLQLPLTTEFMDLAPIFRLLHNDGFTLVEHCSVSVLKIAHLRPYTSLTHNTNQY